MAVSSWLPDVGAIEAGRARFQAFLDRLIQELHLRKDDPEAINALAHDLNLSRDDIHDVVTEPGSEPDPEAEKKVKTKTKTADKDEKKAAAAKKADEKKAAAEAAKKQVEAEEAERLAAEAAAKEAEKKTAEAEKTSVISGTFQVTEQKTDDTKTE